MTDGSLSPFYENTDKSFSRQSLSRLEYEVSTLKTEKKLLQKSKDSAIGRYEELLAKKNDELARLQTNFDYVYSQRSELQSKLENHKSIAGRNSSDFSKDANRLRAENDALQRKLDKYERLLSSVSSKSEHLRADLNRELAANDLYRERISTLEQENARLAGLNEDLLGRMKLISAQMDTSRAENRVEELQMRVLALQNTNNLLQCKVDSLLQNKTSVELLKQKNSLMASRIHALEGFEHKAAELELANAKLQSKFDEYFGAISASVEKSEGSDDDTVLSFILSFKQLQNRNLVLFDKLNEAQSRNTQLESTNSALAHKIDNDLVPQMDRLQQEKATAEREIAELKKVRVLNTKEIEFLRNSLKDMDTVAMRKSTVDASASASTESLQEQEAQKQAMNQYLTNLEKLVDDYKTQIEQLTREQNKNSIAAVPSKRPRLVEDFSDVKTIKDLRSENLELSAQIKDLTDEISAVKKKLTVAENNSKRKSGSVLQLRSNPFAKDQLVKQETLDLLRKENEDLIARFVKNGTVESVPKSIFARQENDKDALQIRIDELNKKLNRLKSVYTEKSREIFSIISMFFGYVIEFIPSTINPNDFCSKIKLVSKYMIKADKEQPPPYLILDVKSKSLKANGNYEFKAMCEDLVSRWVNEKHQIPCFLSALNLKIFEESVRLENA